MEHTGILERAEVSTPITARPGINSAKPLVHSQLVTKESLDALWPELVPLMEKAMEVWPGQLSLEGLYKGILSGHLSAFCTYRGENLRLITILCLVHYAGYSAARVILCAGEGLHEAAAANIDALDAWALTQGAVEIEAWVRPVMQRYLQDYGYEYKAAIVSRNLRGKLQ